MRSRLEEPAVGDITDPNDEYTDITVTGTYQGMVRNRLCDMWKLFTGQPVAIAQMELTPESASELVTFIETVTADRTGDRKAGLLQ